MKKQYTILCLILLVFTSIQAQKEYFNYRLYPGGEYSQTPHIVADYPYYYLMGLIQETPAIRRILVYKGDTLGNILWKKIYGDTLNLYATGYGFPGACVGIDGNIYYRGGYIDSVGLYKVFLLSIRPDGQQRFLKIFGNGDTTFDAGAYNIIPTSDGSIMMHGTIANPAQPPYQHFLLKTDTLGNELWQQQYGGNKDEISTSMCETPDKGFILGAWTESYGNSKPYYKPYIVKTDSAGNFQWQKTYGSPIWASDGKPFVMLTQDGNILVGYDHWLSKTFFTELPEAFKVRLIKLDLAGNTIWDKYVDYWSNGSKGLTKIAETPNGDLLLMLGGQFPFLLKTSATGALLWDSYINRAYDFTHVGYQESGYFIRTPGGSLIVAGWMNTNHNPLPSKYGCHVMKLDNRGCNLNSPPILTDLERIVGQNGDNYVSLCWQDTSGNPNRGYHVVRAEYNPITDYPGEFYKGAHITTYMNKGPLQQMCYTDTIKTFLLDTIRETYEYYVYAVDLTDSTATCASNRIITYPVSISEANKNEWQVKVFPVPFTDWFTVTWFLPEDEQTAEMQLIELAGGKIISTYRINQLQGIMQIETTNLSNGVYVLKFITGKHNTYIKKLVKTN